ncbi:MAG: hypothetical protein ACREXJ_00175 [Gammaproteobacteria bacterium]
MLRFTHDGQEYEFDPDKLPLAEAIMVKKHTGMGMAPYMQGLRDVDPEAIQAMVFLAKRRAGEKVKFEDIDFDLIELAGSLKRDPTPAERADAEPDAEPDTRRAAGEPADPTWPGSSDDSVTGMTRAPAAPATSGPSPTT